MAFRCSCHMKASRNQEKIMEKEDLIADLQAYSHTPITKTTKHQTTQIERAREGRRKLIQLLNS